jgi:hypothetical protein
MQPDSRWKSLGLRLVALDLKPYQSCPGCVTMRMLSAVSELGFLFFESGLKPQPGTLEMLNYGGHL